MTNPTRRWTAQEMRDFAHDLDGDPVWPTASRMLRQAAQTEAQVMWLVEALERIVSDSEVCPLDAEDAETYASIAREALSKFRGEDA